MIPTMLVLGLLAGLALPSRWVWWSVPALGVVWGALLTTQPQPDIGPLLALLGGIPLGMVNAGVGVLAGRGLRVGMAKIADR